MKRLPELCLLVLGICIMAWLLLGDGCGHKQPRQPHRDTVYVKGVPDTVLIRDTIRTIVKQPIAVRTYVSDTVFMCDSIRVYANIDNSGKVTVRDSVRGYLLSQQIDYIQDSIFITRVDTMRITEYPPLPVRTSLYVGIMFSRQLIPYISVGRGRTQVLAGYGLIDKSIMFGIGYRLKQ